MGLRSFLSTPRRHSSRLSREFDRVYHVHIRKSAGSSVNNAFLEEVIGPDTTARSLAQSKDHYLTGRRGPAVGWNKRYLERGCYLYGFSHIPIWDLRLPPRTFTFSIFRDPVERAFSHYRMLRGYIENKIDHPCLAVEGPWATSDFRHFMDTAAPEHLLNQLYMFSPNLSVDEAVSRINNLTVYSTVADFGRVVSAVNHTFSLNAPLLHSNRSAVSQNIDHSELINFRDRFASEYQMFEKLKIDFTVPLSGQSEV